MSTTALARNVTRRVGRAKATVVALCLGGSLALTGGIAAHAARADVVNGAGTTTVGTSGTSSTSGTSGSSSTGSGDTGVSSASGGSSDATSQGS